MTEYAWLIENAESEPCKPLYYRGDNYESRPEDDESPFSVWSYDHTQAVRFCRKEDAAKLKFLSEVRICEHSWG